MTLLSDFFGGGGLTVWETPWMAEPANATVIVGNELIDTTVTSTTLNTFIPNSATDIDNPDPGDWVDLIDISGAALYKVSFASSPVIQLTNIPALGISLRLQAIANGIIVADGKIVGDGVLSTLSYKIPLLINNDFRTSNYSEYIRNSFKLRVARSGTIASASTNLLATGLFSYGEVEVI